MLMSEAEAFAVETYKKMDAMKAQIFARCQELTGQEPTEAYLQRLCWDIWRLTTFHISAWRGCCGEDGCDASHAPYTPPEVVGERTERLLAMDARLEAVLGDAVEGDDGDDDDEEEDGDGFDFEPTPEEQIMMVEYGSIIVTYREFVEALNPLRLGEGDDGVIQNIIQLHYNGFDVVMRVFWDWLVKHLYQEQSVADGDER
jgi:hypothetical protein